MTRTLPLPQLIGQLIVGGYEGEAPTPSLLRAISEGRRGGAIFFRRNLPTIERASANCLAILDSSPAALPPPFLGIDQEGGRVRRLPAPALNLPPMRALGEVGDRDLVFRAASAVAKELRAIGYNVNFAPVLDVDTHPDNPVIGDRSFGNSPEAVSLYALAFMEGLQRNGVLACGKHFPGHGDTHLDSHFALPAILHDRERLEAIELAPFRAAIEAGIGSMMSAHIVCESLDDKLPATLSFDIATKLLREDLGFRGPLFSDDFEMKAIADRYSYEDAAPMAISAGCDILLICRDEEAQERAYEGLIRRAERDSRFLERCQEAVSRSLDARRAYPPKPTRSPEELSNIVGGEESLAIVEKIGALIS